MTGIWDGYLVYIMCTPLLVYIVILNQEATISHWLIDNKGFMPNILHIMTTVLVGNCLCSRTSRYQMLKVVIKSTAATNHVRHDRSDSKFGFRNTLPKFQMKLRREVFTGQSDKEYNGSKQTASSSI